MSKKAIRSMRSDIVQRIRDLETAADTAATEARRHRLAAEHQAAQERSIRKEAAEWMRLLQSTKES